MFLDKSKTKRKFFKNTQTLGKMGGLGFLVLAIFLLAVSFSHAATGINKQINYQGKLTDNLGVSVADGKRDMVFKIYDASTGGNLLWTGTYTAANSSQDVQVTNGMFSVMLGSGTGNAMTLDFSTDSYYLTVNVAGDGEMSPRKRIGAVPQAINANNLIGDGLIKITGAPTGTGVSQGTVYVNPASATSGQTLLGLAVGGTQKFKVDEAGNVALAGAITAGTWNGSTIGVGYGGTGTAAQFTQGSLVFAGASGVYNQNNAQLFWDNTNYRLGLGTTSPASMLSLYGTSNEMRFSYDATNYSTISADATGQLQIKGASVYDATLTLGGNDAQNVALIFDNNSNATDFYVGVENIDDSGKFKIGLLDNDAFLTVTNTGNVGIGTTGPSEKLHVTGAVLAGTAAASNGSLVLAGIYNGANDYLLTLGSMYSSGGTTLGYGVKPSTVSNSYVSATSINAARSALTMDGTAIRFLTASTQTVAQDSAVTMAEKMTILNSGNVGIGTTGPGAKLDVSSASGGSGSGIRLIQAAESGVAGTSYIPIDFTVPTTGLIGQFLATAHNYVNGGTNLAADSVALLSYASNGQLLLGQTGSTGYISFDTGGVGAANERMRINSSGNVGIGTTAPVALLALNGGTTAALGINFGDATANLYRAGAGSIKTDGNLIVNGYISATSGGAVVTTRSNRADLYGLNGVSLSYGAGFTQGLVIDTTGNVGIGTTAPGSKLHVQGTAWAISGTAKATVLIDDTTSFATGVGGAITFRGKYNTAGDYVAGGYIQTQKANATDGNDSFDLALGTRPNGSGVAEVMRLSSNGNVGIGTTAPGSKLHVQGTAWAISGTAKATVLIDDTTSFATGVGGAITFRGKYNTAGDYVAGGYIQTQKANATDGNDSFDLALGTRPNGSGVAEVMRLSSNGNVGIGTTGPGYKLEVAGSVVSKWGSEVADSILFESQDAGGNVIASLRRSDGAGGTANDLLIRAYEDIHFAPNNTSNALVTFKASGNVGIGTTNPTAKLQIKGAGTTTGINFQTLDSAGTGLVTVLDNGNVGIGTTEPGTYKLNIAGTGYLGAAAWVYSSDERLKENIAYFSNNPTPDSLEKIMQLKPAKFDYITGDKNNIGFIAQDVQKIIPEAVSITNSETGMLGLKTDFIMPYLVGALQQLASSTTTMQTQLTSLDEKYAALRAQNEALSEFLTISEGIYDLKNGSLKAKGIAADTIVGKDIEASNSLKLGDQISGTGVIKAGELESAKILTTQINANVKLYITSRGSTAGKLLYYDETKVEDGIGFTVKIDAPAIVEDIKFNWLIVK
ncbi:MAG: tail fiber domain-containing protein [Candidatus Moraniibacteriota bacterium]